MVDDRDMSSKDETIENTYRLAGEIEELNEYIRDPVSKLILTALLASPGPVGGEKLYRMVRELIEASRGKGGHVSGVTRASFYRRLKMLARYGLVIPLGSGRRSGPYIVRPSVRLQFARLAADHELGFFDRIEEELSREACKLIEALNEGRLLDAFSSLNRLESYFEAEAKALLYMMIEELFYIKQLQSENTDSYPEERAKLSRVLGKLESMPEELKDDIVQFSIAKALYLTTPIYLIQTPLKALYKAVIKEEC